MNNICEHIILVQLMESLSNVNHAMNVVGKCISLLKLQKYLPFSIES